MMTCAMRFSLLRRVKLTFEHKDKDLWLGYGDGAGDDSVITGSKGQSPTSCAGLGQADMGSSNGRVFGKMTGAGGFPPPTK